MAGQSTLGGIGAIAKGATTNTFPGPGTLTIFLLFAVVTGMAWEPVRPFVYVLLVLILADLLFQAEPNITAFTQQLTGGK